MTLTQSRIIIVFNCNKLPIKVWLACRLAGLKRSIIVISIFFSVWVQWFKKSLRVVVFSLHVWHLSSCHTKILTCIFLASNNKKKCVFIDYKDDVDDDEESNEERVAKIWNHKLFLNARQILRSFSVLIRFFPSSSLTSYSKSSSLFSPGKIFQIYTKIYFLSITMCRLLLFMKG